MIVVGLHFGHDANISVFRDGQLLGFYEKERHTRVRHALGLTSKEVNDFLGRFQIDLSDVDVCAITSTQKIPFLDWDGSLEIALEGEARIALKIAEDNSYLESSSEGENYRAYIDPSHPVAIKSYELSERFPSVHKTNRWVGSYAAIAAAKNPKDFSPFHKQKIKFSLGEKSPKEAWFISHHLAHAQYGYFFSPFKRPLIVTYDGYTASDFSGGGIYFGYGALARPMQWHGFWCGTFYNRVAGFLGLGKNGSAGKLMGLAAYGLPIYVNPELTGTAVELQKYGPFSNGGEIADYWLREIIPGGRKALPKWNGLDRPPEMQANIAASAQVIFQNNCVGLIEAATAMARSNDFSFDGIVLSGGCALNCPANTLIAQKFGPVFIPPAINDEGLSLGSAALFLGEADRIRSGGPEIAYLGCAYKVISTHISNRWGSDVEIVAEGDASLEQLAKELHNGAIIGFYHGSSEIGPRALGHRSILASPLIAANWERTNKVKQREVWRPFAPIVTEEACGTYFMHTPARNHFMLFNSRVKSNVLSAVTHVDGTARVQVATEACGPVYDLLKAFGKISGHEVLLNTSFNGKREPIVEAPEHAISGMLRLGLDALYLNGVLLKPKRKQANLRIAAG